MATQTIFTELICYTNLNENTFAEYKTNYFIKSLRPQKTYYDKIELIEITLSITKYYESVLKESVKSIIDLCDLYIDFSDDVWKLYMEEKDTIELNHSVSLSSLSEKDKMKLACVLRYLNLWLHLIFLFCKALSIFLDNMNINNNTKLYMNFKIIPHMISIYEKLKSTGKHKLTEYERAIFVYLLSIHNIYYYKRSITNSQKMISSLSSYVLDKKINKKVISDVLNSYIINVLLSDTPDNMKYNIYKFEELKKHPNFKKVYINKSYNFIYDLVKHAPVIDNEVIRSANTFAVSNISFKEYDPDYDFIIVPVEAIQNLLYMIECDECFEIEYKLLICAKCKKVFYCSSQCQKKRWASHKKNCKP